MTKSPDAFRTISEVAEWLDRPAHVLRFWESKFTQVKPIKRAGGRRYYRPQDMLLLGGIKKLLHDDGMTIKGVQKMLREHGVAHVSDLSQPLDATAEAGELVPSPEKIAALRARNEAPESATLLQFPTNPPLTEDADPEPGTVTYEQAISDLSPDMDADLADTSPAIEDSDLAADETTETAEQSATPSEGAFQTPSFFDVFDKTSDDTPIADDAQISDAEPAWEDDVSPDPTPEPDLAPEPEPDTELAMDESIETASEMPENTVSPVSPIDTDDTIPPEVHQGPAVVDVPVEAYSNAGSGILTRLIQNQAVFAAMPPPQLAALRDQVSDLKSKLSGN